jgi:hypothetical protein
MAMKWVLAAACAVMLAAATPAQAVVFNAPRGESAFKVPRGVTQIKATAVGERGANGVIGREVVASVPVAPGAMLTLRVGVGGGLSGVFDGADPLVVAAGGDGGPSFPDAGVPATRITPALTLEYGDDDAPLVSLDPPAGLNPVSIEGVAGTEGGDGGGVSIRLYPGERPEGEPVSATNVGFGADGRFATAVGGQLSDGVWTAQAVQFDSAGHVGVSDPVTFTVDHGGPRIQLTGPGPITNDPQIEGIAGSEPGDLEEVTVTVTGPGGYRETVVASLRGVGFHVTLADALADGTYTAVARQEDRYHHVGTATLTFVVDTVAPRLTLDGADGGMLTGTASEPGDVVITVGAVTVTVPVVDGAYSATLAPPDGAYTATARLLDAAGNTAVATRSFRVVSPVAPVASGPAPAITTPAAVPKPIALRITSAKRRGRALTVKGTASGTGTVTVSAAGQHKRVRLTRGKWSATLELRRAKRVTITVSYADRIARKTVR